MEPVVEQVSGHKKIAMFRAIGILIILWGLSTFFTASFNAFDRMLTAVFSTVEVAAEQSETQIQSLEANP